MILWAVRRIKQDCEYHPLTTMLLLGMAIGWACPLSLFTILCRMGIW